MNDWGYKPVAIVEADDFQDRYDRNGLDMLFYWKTKYPNFKITLFTIPQKTSSWLLDKLYSDWMEFAIHGWDHESVWECYDWDFEKTGILLDRAMAKGPYQRIFKAPGWCVTPDYNGYPADPTATISKDKQAVYKALRDRDYIIFDRHYNKPARPEGCKVVCVDCNPKIVHFHTWDMIVQGQEHNGFRQVEEEKGVPWDDKTEFYFVTEAWEKGLFEPCKS